MDGARDVAGAKLPKQLGRLTEKVRRSMTVAAAKRREDIFPPLARAVFIQVRFDDWWVILSECILKFSVEHEFRYDC